MSESIKASELDPPAPWTKLYFAMASQGRVAKTTRSVTALTNKELSWVLRVGLAERERRKGLKSVEKSA